MKLDKVDWANLFKVRISNPDPSMTKHEVVKLILVMKLLFKHRDEKNYIRIYTEFKANDKTICDVYMENLKTKEAFAFEVQRDYSPKWLEKKKEEYKDWDVPLFNSADWIPINLNECPEKIEEINKWLEKYLV